MASIADLPPGRPAPGRSAWRRAVAALAIPAILVASCSGADSVSGSAAGSTTKSFAADSASPGATSPTSPITPPDTPAATPPPVGGPMKAVTEPVTVGADLFDALVGAGIDPPLAIILAESTHTLDVTDGHTFTIRTEFPVGAEATVTYHLFANTTRSPDDPPVITGAIDGDTLRYTMDYAIDRAALPVDLLAQIDGSLPASPPSGLLPGLRPPGGGAFARDGGSGDAIGAAVEGEISQVREFAIDNALETAVESTASGKVQVAAGSWDAYKASKKV